MARQSTRLFIFAGIAAFLAAAFSGKLPRWFRVVLVISLLLSACGAALFGYRYITAPTTLTIAAGSLDGDAPKIIGAIAARMAASGSSVRLKLLHKDNALEAANAFSSGEADLAVARSDIGDLPAARNVVLLTYVVAMIVTPPGSTIESIDDLKGKTLGIIGAPINKQISGAISKAYDFDRLKVAFKDLNLNDAQAAVQSKQVQALLAVLPISERYLAMLRDIFPRNSKLSLGLVPIESAGAIAANDHAYESFDLPKGTLRGSPAIPDDDITTLRVPIYLIANKKLGDNVVGELVKAIMETRRDLIAEFPILAQIGAPSTDKDAYIPIHPGAASYFDGEQKSFLEQYGDQFYNLTIILGAAASIIAAAWKFLIVDPAAAEINPLIKLQELKERIGLATSESDLADIEQMIDEILKEELAKHASGDAEASETAALGLATHRLERLINQRRFFAASSIAGKSTT